MINRVNGNDYYDYTKLSMPTSAETTGNGEKFSLDYQRAEDEKEEDEGKEKISKDGMGKNPAGNNARTVMQSGVKLELSGNGREKDSAGQGNTLSVLLDTVRTWAAVFVQSFKELLNRIWNDPVPEEEILSAEEIPVEETDRLSEEYLDMNPPEAVKEEPVDGLNGNETPIHESGNLHNGRQSLGGRVNRDMEIQKYLRSGNLEQVISLLTEDGQRTIAKNSSLLTYYDKTGRLTSLSASDQERILHGDRNTRKL